MTLTKKFTKQFTWGCNDVKENISLFIFFVHDKVLQNRCYWKTEKMRIIKGENLNFKTSDYFQVTYKIPEYRLNAKVKKSQFFILFYESKSRWLINLNLYLIYLGEWIRKFTFSLLLFFGFYWVKPEELHWFGYMRWTTYSVA